MVASSSSPRRLLGTSHLSARRDVASLANRAYHSGLETRRLLLRKGSPHMTRRRTSPLVVALVIVLGMVAPLLDTTIVTVAIPSLRQDLGATVSTIQWISTGYLLAMA